MELLPLSLNTRTGKGLPDGETLNCTLSPLFGPCMIVLVKVAPVVRALPDFVLAMPPVFFFVAMISPWLAGVHSYYNAGISNMSNQRPITTPTPNHNGIANRYLKGVSGIGDAICLCLCHSKA